MSIESNVRICIQEKINEKRAECEHLTAEDLEKSLVNAPKEYTTNGLNKETLMEVWEEAEYKFTKWTRCTPLITLGLAVADAIAFGTYIHNPNENKITLAIGLSLILPTITSGITAIRMRIAENYFYKNKP